MTGSGGARPDPADARVTVVVPTRNRREVLATTVASVLDQRDVELRLVVVDEASDDGTAAWLDGLDDPRVAVLRNDPPLGVAAARNRGLEHVATPWVAFCDDDDPWAPTKLAEQLAALAGTPDAGWACVGSVSVDPALRIVGHQRPPAPDGVGEALGHLNLVPGGGSGVVAATALVRDAGGWDESLRVAADHELYLRLATRSRLAVVDEPLLAYRIWDESMSFDVEALRREREVIVARGGDTDHVRRHAADLRFEQYLARRVLRTGDRRAAAHWYLWLARRYRLPGHVLHGAAALVAPRPFEQWRARRERAAVPSRWVERAEAWLAPLREPRRG